MRAVVVFFIVSSTAAAADLSPGAYRLSYSRGPDSEVAACILKLEPKGGGWFGTLVSGNTQLGRISVGAVAVGDGLVRIDLKLWDSPVAFEGVVAGDGKAIRGSYGDAARVVTATLSPTEDARIDRSNMFLSKEIPAPLAEYLKLESERARLIAGVFQGVGRLMPTDGEMADRLRQIDDEGPALLRRCLAEQAAHPAAGEAAQHLLASAHRSATTSEQVRAWAGLAVSAAGAYGPRYRRDAMVRAAESAGRVPDAAAAAAELAERAEAALGPDAAPERRARLLAILAEARRASGSADADAVQRLAAVESTLDEQARKSVARFEVRKYVGRRNAKGRNALFELFTGSHSTDSAAVVAAVDRFGEVYTKGEVIVLRYHLHVSAPDPLASADGEERWGYYVNAWPRETRLIPTGVISGRPRVLGGGPAAAAREKLVELRDGINPVLEQATDVKIVLKAVRSGDRLTITAELSGLEYDTDNLRFRVAVAEDEVRYSGGNGVRFHQRVVRAMPGGATGATPKGPADRRELTVDLADLRKRQAKEWEEHARRVMPFPDPFRPYDLKKLSVVAWVQDDKSHAVLQAAQADVP